MPLLGCKRWRRWRRSSNPSSPKRWRRAVRPLTSAAVPDVPSNFACSAPGPCGPAAKGGARTHEDIARLRSADEPPQLAELIQGGFHPLDCRGIGLRTAAPAQRIADLIERSFPAHHPVEHMRPDLAYGLRRLAISLPMKDLGFCPRHPGKIGAIGRKDPRRRSTVAGPRGRRDTNDGDTS